MRGVISAGHELTARAGVEIFSLGGNAFDAAVSATFASFVTEPALTSPGGGGFMITHCAGGETKLYDFFVDVPGRGRARLPEEMNFFSVFIDFADIRQELHVGRASAATPGVIKGLLEVFNNHCTLDLSVLLSPAIRYAREGILLNAWQAYFNELLSPMLNITAEARAIYAPGGSLLKVGDTIRNPAMADTLEDLAVDGLESFYNGPVAEKIIEGFGAGGLITCDDLLAYEVKVRKPLEIQYRGRKIYTNPAPSSGGSLIAFALKLLEPFDIASMGCKSVKSIVLMSEVMRVANEFRRAEFDRAVHEEGQIDRLLEERNITAYRELLFKGPAETPAGLDSDKSSVLGNTTQISTVDASGNAASITTSTGIGCGYMIPGTGIMMNNMLGEEDLNPGGFHSQASGARMSSMMAPTMVMRSGVPEIVLGSGGSKRIRSAIVQVIVNILDHSMEVDRAVNSSRVHMEDGVLQVEYGFDKEVVDALKKTVGELNEWKERNLYFGGVHSVVDISGALSGAGDTRRGGLSLISES